MKERKLIRVDYTYKVPLEYDRTKYETGGFGSFVVDEDLEFWLIVKGREWNDFNEDYADLIVSYLRGLGKTRFTVEDLEVPWLDGELSGHYMYDVDDNEASLKGAAREISLSSIKEEDVLETSLPQSLRVKGVGDFKTLLELLEFGVRLRVE